MNHFSFEGYTLASEPIMGLPKRSLHLLKFRTARNKQFLSLVSTTAVYQLDERVVVAHLYGREPQVNLSVLHQIITDAPVAFIWPLNVRPNRAIADTIARLFPRGTLSYHVFTVGKVSNYGQ